MRHILVLLFCVIFTDLSFGQGDAPALLQGQHQSTKSVGSFIQAPNKQITKISGATALMETGNKNLLENPSFEHPTVGFGWTDASTNTKSAETTVVIDGKKSLKIELSANDVNLTQTSTLYASQFGGTTQGVASIRIKTDVLVVICTVEAGVTSTTNCLNSSLDNQWHVYKIPFVLGATSNGINIFVDSGTGTVYLDDAFVGAMEVTAVTDASRIAGEAVFPPTSSCIWFRNNAVIGAFASTNACPGPTIVKEYVGDWQTTDANLPQITINALPAGVYKATFYVPLYSSAAAQNSLAINDGTTTCDAVNVHSNTDSGQGVVSCTFHYGVAGNRTFSLYGASSTSLINIENNTSGSATRGTKFQLEYYTSFSTYSSTNADTDWASCGHTTASFTGFGTVSAIQTQCKRQGSDLLMRGKFTSQTGTATELRLALPSWNGSLLASSGTSIIPSIQQAGKGNRSSTTTTFFSGITLLIEPSVNYLTFGGESSSLSGTDKATGSSLAGGGPYTWMINARIPIEGWQNSNIIIAQLNGLERCADTYQCTDTFSAFIDTSGNVSNENIDWINGNCTTSAGIFTCGLKTGLSGAGSNLTTGMNCNVTAGAGTSTVTFVATEVRSSTTTQVVYGTNNTTDFAHPVYISCQKGPTDFLSKTAKAVASDQNLRTPGITKGVVHSCRVNNNGTATLDSASGTCSSFISSVNRTSAGAVTINFSASSFLLNPICTISNAQSGAYKVCQFDVAPTTSSALTVCANGVTTPADTAFNIICHGVSP